MHYTSVLLNFIYAIIGGCLTIGFMVLAYKIFDKITPFDTAEELKKGNRAVGQVILGVLIGIGVAIGLVVGLGLN